MDSLTQAVLGAGIQGAMLGRFQGRKALLAGAALATLPDLDVLIDYGDPVSGMINHRGFSHSLFVLTLLAGALAWAMRRWRPSPLYGPGRLFLTLWLVLITHPLLDAFTSYGTQLWWPLRPTPTAWSSVFIIDPFFTVPLLLVVLVGLVVGKHWRMQPAFCWALAWCAAYLAMSVGAKAVIEARVRRQLEAEGKAVAALFSTPQPFSILLWRVLARTDGDRYIETIAGLADGAPGESLEAPLNSGLAGAVGDTPQLRGLRWFTGDWLRYDAIGNQLVVSDLRMGLGTGYYSFRFLVARRNGEGAPWTAVTPAYWHRERGLEEFPAVMRRILRPDPPLPLHDWEALMTLQRGMSAR
ncbi:metal-dependent hydrolase [Parapusillimonas granuli]|uniref:Metal-dependent hydrolase n=1 Tax=Parapusillimonas granuli TaxID=380911 RepID=A0A853G840_9BURK|nr:metal-dependent hydrolase [Parapusillimonas granuli]MBB5215901.1 inner membrane protein [Parapusillimonas granuli]MEB2399408.1 metal-dependent hydrolase [Alcaligenaceae bacterium]NYT50801.1 metal-dependent hydrolase [Parapusillimonas granuli]